MKNKLIGTVLSLLLLCGTSAAHAYFMDGSSAENAGFSAKQILQYGWSGGDGIYWMDFDGVGGVGPTEIYADMTTYGGGWTALVDTWYIPSLSTISLTGAGFAQASLLEYEADDAVNQTNEFLIKLDGLDAWMISKVEVGPSSVELSEEVSLHSTYHANWTNEADEVIYGLTLNDILSGSATGFRVFVREEISSYPEFENTQPAPVPEPASMLLFGTGIAGLVGARARKRKK